MKKLTNTEIDNIEAKLRITLPRFYRKLLVEAGYGETKDQKGIYHPAEINELYELKFDDESLLYNKYFPIGCNHKTQELWIIDVTNDKIASIWHEIHEDDWPNEFWSEYEVWIEKNIELTKKYKQEFHSVSSQQGDTSQVNAGVGRKETAMSNKVIRMCIIIVSVLLVVAMFSWWFLESRNTYPRGQALADALRPVIDEQSTDRAIVAKVILTNYLEVRANASRWSGVYWGCTFVAAIFSALAGLILKIESVPIEEKTRKDLAATLAVIAAILVTISTSGDFQRKWQANRIAAAEIERVGYAFLENDGTNARSFLSAIGNTLLQRHIAIVGGTDGNTISGNAQDPSTSQ